MNIIKQAIHIIQEKQPDIDAIYIFGSHGSLYETQDSDLDIAILALASIDPIQRWELAQDIAYIIHRDVDLIDLRSASTVLRFEIISSGKRVFCRDSDLCDSFETTVYSAYVRFNDERRDLLNDIKKRGGQIFHG